MKAEDVGILTETYYTTDNNEYKVIYHFSWVTEETLDKYRDMYNHMPVFTVCDGIWLDKTLRKRNRR